MKKSIFHFSILAFLFTLVAACGGGGGDQPSTQSTNTQTPPVTTPVVTPPVTTPITPVVTTPVVTPKPTPSELIITVEATSPMATEILRTDTRYARKITINIQNPTSTDQEITIPSISVGGDLANDFADVQLVSAGKVLGTGVISGGKAYFSSITLNVLAGTSQKVTVQAKIDPSMQPLGSTVWSKKANFGFTTDDIIPSSAPISGLPVWGSYVYVDKGNKSYPCPDALCSANMETNKWHVLYSQYNSGISTIVPIRNNSGIAFVGGNLDGVLSYSSLSTNTNSIIGGNFTVGGETCTTNPTGPFDFTEKGDVIAIITGCSKPGQAGRRDVMLLKTDGSYDSIFVTKDTAREFYPAIGSDGDVTSNNLIVLFAKETTSGKGKIWKVSINVNTNVIEKEKLIADNTPVAYGYDRGFSVNKDYTKVVFVRDVNNNRNFHLFITSINGGKDVDIGKGTNPYWATDGSNRIVFMNDGLWIMDGDGKNRRKMILPENLARNLTGATGREIVLSATYP